MLYRIFGRAGSGKTDYLTTCLRERLERGEECIFIVPEQQTVSTERLLQKSGAAGLLCEILNFERLPNLVKRSEGGLALRFIDKGGKTVLMKLCLDKLSDELQEYGHGSLTLVKELVSTVTSLKINRINPEELSAVAERMAKGANKRLASKLKDLSLIYKEYQSRLTESFADTGDELNRLSELLKTSDFFKGKSVFVDGYYTFTEQEYSVLNEIVRTAKDVFVSFVCDEDDTGIFDETVGAANRLRSFAMTDFKDVFMPESVRSLDKGLKTAEKLLWHTEREPFSEKAESISLVKCSSRFDEAESAAAEIYRLLQKGYGFNDIAVVFRNCAAYDGVIDAIFEKYGIPFHFSVKDSVAVKPLSAFVTGLLEMAASNFSLSSVKKYLKSSFSVLDTEEIDLLLRYADSWKLKGKAWKSEKDWLMNPNGYKAELSSDEEELLLAVNKARKKLRDSVVSAVEELQSKELSLDKGAKLIYRHLLECKTDKRLVEASEQLKNGGDADEAAKLVQLWDVFINIFDQLHLLAEGSKTTARELKELIELMLDEYSVGSIPAYSEAVTVGDAKLLRCGGVKAMLILGVLDGEFPSLSSHGGLFTLSDGLELEKEGISIVKNLDSELNEERFLFYVCVSSPKEYLYLSYPDEGNPSPAFNDLAQLFPHNSVKLFGADESDRLFCKRAAFERLPFIKDQALKASVTEALKQDSTYAPLLERAAAPLQDPDAYVGTRTAKLLFLSSTKIEKYNNCAFSYMLNYILKLKDNRTNSFSSLDVGQYLHKMLEGYMKKRMESGTFKAATAEETKLELDVLSDSYVKTVMQAPPKRILFLLERMKNMLRYVCASLNEEFAHSRFRPCGIEVRIGNGELVPARRFTTPKGRELCTVGQIDRVDDYTENGKRYVRVVDYKSGTKTLDVEKVKEGENIQMLSYLYAITEADSTAVPSAVLYRHLTLPKDITKTKSCANQHGLVLNDLDLIEKMDTSAEKAFLPVSLTKDGSLDKRTAKNAISAEGFDALNREICELITEVGEKICDGEMSVKPLRKKETDCSYCRYGEICRQQNPAKQKR